MYICTYAEVSLCFGILQRYWQTRLQELVEAWAGVTAHIATRKMHCIHLFMSSVAWPGWVGAYGYLRHAALWGRRPPADACGPSAHACRIADHQRGPRCHSQTLERRDIWLRWQVRHDVEPMISDSIVVWVSRWHWNGESLRLHEVEMEEGDIVYYESARCLHGRMQPLRGDFNVHSLLYILSLLIVRTAYCLWNCKAVTMWISSRIIAPWEIRSGSPDLTQRAHPSTYYRLQYSYDRWTFIYCCVLYLT